MDPGRAMESYSSGTDNAGFSAAEGWIGDLEPRSAAQVIAAAADVALVVDADGIVRDLSFSANEHPPKDFRQWVGRRWADIVTVESKAKVAELLRDASPSKVTRGREVNHASSSGGDVPIRFVTIRMNDDGKILALGRDLRPIAAVQQKLVEAQLSLEREYSRLRNVETRYRLMFQLSSEAVVIVEDTSERIVEANAAASRITGDPVTKLVGRDFSEIFDKDSLPVIKHLFGTARTLGQSDGARVRIAGEASDLSISASLFRNDNATHILVRLTNDARDGALDDGEGRSLAYDVIERLPDGFIVVDSEQRILEANAAFLSMVELISIERVKGARLDGWLGRPGLDAGLLISNLREHGSLRDFSTVLRGQFGSVEQVEVTGVSVPRSGGTCYGLLIRPARRRTPAKAVAAGPLFRSVEQLTELVGRVPLKDLVRETTDLVERLCIEAALKLTEDNRASAAQILGVSRQSLYSKLHRYGLLREGEVIDLE